MARKSRFSFSALSRGQSYDENDRAASKQRATPSSQSGHAFDPTSKADEVLGPSERSGSYQHPEGPNKGNIRERLKKQCSSLSITITESRPVGAKAYRRTKEGERMQALSPKLGPADNVSITSITGRSIRTKGSTSTIQSHYDPAQSPLSVSQQTSASSARDMALRKGYPPILSPFRQSTFQESSDKRGLRRLHRGNKQNELGQRTIPNPDFSVALTKTQSVPCSPSVMAAGSEIQSPLSPSLRNWLGRQMSRMIAQPRLAAKSSQEIWQAEIERRLATDSFTLKLPQPKQDVENWLDDAELDDTFDTMGEISTLQMFVKGGRSSLNSSTNSSDYSTSSVRTLTSQVSDTARTLQTLQYRQSMPPSDKPKPAVARRGSQLRKSARVSKITNSDLHIESVLALSSSDEESEAGTDPPRIYPHGSPKASANTSSKGTKVLESPSNNRTSTLHQHRKGLSVGTTISSSGHRPSASVRNHSPSSSRKSGISHHRQTSSVHWHADMVRDRHPLHPSSQSSLVHKKSESSLRKEDRPLAPTTLAHLEEDSPRTRLSRMMAVTPEEEKLLSAMRHKRASMRKAVHEEGISLAVEHRLTAPRPKTADAVKQSTSFFEPDMTCFPKPPGPGSNREHCGTIGNLLRGAVSSEDLRLISLDAFQSSSSVGSSESGILPSPSVSHDDPLTPASAICSAGLDGFGDGALERFDEFGSEGQAREGVGHARKRTMSSVLCLDGVEERARAREVEEDLVMWRIDRCI